VRSDFLVYVHTRLDNGKPFYVGKGTIKRIRRSTNRNKHWKRIVDKCNGFDSIIIKGNLTEGDAFQLEKDTIAEYRLKNINLCNYTDGGDGPSGYKHTDECKLKMSKLAKGRPAHNKGGKASDSAKEKMSLAKLGKKLSKEHIEKVAASKRGKPLSYECRTKISNSLTGKRHTNETKIKMSTPVVCLTNGTIYNSMTQASNELSVWASSITRVCQGVLSQTRGLKFSYLNQTLTA
jgi:hypothetical protein